MIKEISFVVPAYNEEEHIGKCISSIKESMDDFNEYPGENLKYEIIVVDNTSTDKTALIALHNDAFVAFENKKGVVFARDRGWRQAQYPYVAFIDADNELTSEWVLQLQYSFLDYNVVASSGPLDYHTSGEFTRKGSKFFYKLAVIAHKKIGDMLQGGNFVIKREVLEKMNGFDTSVEFYGEDTTTAKMVAKYGKVIFNEKMIAKSSDRRLDGDGPINTLFKYTMNYFWVTFFNKPLTKEYKDYR